MSQNEEKKESVNEAELDMQEEVQEAEAVEKTEEELLEEYRTKLCGACNVAMEANAVKLRALAEMDNLVSATLSGVETIDQQAFMNCTSLATLSLGEGLGYIRAYAFYGCTSLSEVTMPATLYTIMQGAFAGCTRLTSVNFATGNTSWTVIGTTTDGSPVEVEVLDFTNGTTAAEVLTSDAYLPYMFANTDMLKGQ